tara:strand:+ start:488 stop:685 length:198 start_codon:yes stop_codon:yes gene_type:complete
MQTIKHKGVEKMNNEQPIMAVDMLTEIENWIEYMRTELDNEQIDLAELSEIEQVYDVIKTDLEKK